MAAECKTPPGWRRSALSSVLQKKRFFRLVRVRYAESMFLTDQDTAELLAWRRRLQEDVDRTRGRQRRLDQAAVGPRAARRKLGG